MCNIPVRHWFPPGVCVVHFSVVIKDSGDQPVSFGDSCCSLLTVTAGSEICWLKNIHILTATVCYLDFTHMTEK